MPIAKIPLLLDSLIRARVNRSSERLLFTAVRHWQRTSFTLQSRLRRYKGLPRAKGGTRERMLHLAIAVTLLAAAATVPAKPTSTEFVDRSRLAYSEEEYDEKGTRVSEGNRPKDEGDSYPYQESTAEELAAAVGHRDVVYQDTGNSVNERPRQSIGDGWRDAAPGTPGMDYPNLDRIPVTSFTCADKEAGGYYADTETGCQVFHVCNTGGVKSSFLCPPGSIFNQRHFVCDWWYGFDCDDAVDLYFTKSTQNLEIRREDGPHEKFGNSSKYDENIEAGEGLDPLPERYPKEDRIRNENPTNDLSSAGSGRETVDHPSEGNNRMDQLSPSADLTDANVVDSRNSDRSSNESAPRGFSGNDKDNESLKQRKLDCTTHNSHDLTNDLASYVNDAYFEAGFGNNNNRDNNDKNRGDNSSDETESNESLVNETSLVDKYLYGERTRSGYFSSGEP